MRVVLVSLLVSACFTNSSTRLPCGGKPFVAPEPAPASCKRFATPQELVAYLSGLAAKPDHRVLSGEFVMHSGILLPEDLDYQVENYGSSAGPEMVCVRQMTGKWPAIAGVDYFPTKVGHAQPDLPNRILLDYAAQCGLGMVTLRFTNPMNQSLSIDRDVPFADLGKDGTAADKALKAELDRVAAGFAALQAKGVVVMVRPYPEMNDDRPWWGKRDPAEFKALWKRTRAYLEEAKGLHNLVWVWSPRAGVGAYADYYPGADAVDVVGLAYYGDDVAGLASQGYSEIAALGKPVALAEFGPYHDVSPTNAQYDFTRLIGDIRAKLPKVVLWQSWNSMYGLSRQQKAKELLADPWVVNRGDIQ